METKAVRYYRKTLSSGEVVVIADYGLLGGWSVCAKNESPDGFVSPMPESYLVGAIEITQEEASEIVGYEID